jgi:ribulose-5-phosphate 4-epimerase/fuculose-1-phosphate aldolase
LLTQASTGNTSIKLDGVLWIKASGKWLADARRSDFFIPVDLAEARECLCRNLDPAANYRDAPGCVLQASVETAMHAVMPHAVIVHVHSVNAIAWAVRQDAAARLSILLDGLNWRWIPYVPSGRPLAREVRAALSSAPRTDVFVLGNHGLVVGGENCDDVDRLLDLIERRLSVTPRSAIADENALRSIVFGDPQWTMPDDPLVHSLGVDTVAKRILSEGLLYPCQAMFSTPSPSDLFRPIRSLDAGELRDYNRRPFLAIEGWGTLLNKAISRTEDAMLKGLAQVVQRIDASAPIRYLSEGEIANGLNLEAYRYAELSNKNSSPEHQ